MSLRRRSSLRGHEKNLLSVQPGRLLSWARTTLRDALPAAPPPGPQSPESSAAVFHGSSVAAPPGHSATGGSGGVSNPRPGEPAGEGQAEFPGPCGSTLLSRSQDAPQLESCCSVETFPVHWVLLESCCVSLSCVGVWFREEKSSMWRPRLVLNEEEVRYRPLDVTTVLQDFTQCVQMKMFVLKKSTDWLQKCRSGVLKE